MFQLAERLQERQHHEREHTAAHDARAQRRRTVTHARQLVVGKDEVTGGLGLARLPLGLGIEHRADESGRREFAALRLSPRHAAFPLTETTSLDTARVAAARCSCVAATLQ